MYRRPKFLEILLEIRQGMARDADYDVDRFAEMVRSGQIGEGGLVLSMFENDAAPVRPLEKKPKEIRRKVSGKS